MYFLDINIVELSTSILVLIVGVATTLYGVNKNRKISKFKSLGLEAEGVVFDLIKKDDPEDQSYICIIRFLTKNNIWITREPSAYFSHFGIKKGDKVQVFYDPENPNDFVVYNPITNPIFTIPIIVGIIITIGALYSVIRVLIAND